MFVRLFVLSPHNIVAHGIEPSFLPISSFTHHHNTAPPICLCSSTRSYNTCKWTKIPQRNYIYTKTLSSTSTRKVVNQSHNKVCNRMSIFANQLHFENPFNTSQATVIPLKTPKSNIAVIIELKPLRESKNVCKIYAVYWRVVRHFGQEMLSFQVLGFAPALKSLICILGGSSPCAGIVAEKKPLYRGFPFGF